MPKMKTHKGAAARYGVTGTGKLVRMKRGSSHLRRNKRKATRRIYASKLIVDPTQRKRIQTLVPKLNQ